MNILRNFVAKLTDEQCRQMAADQAIFERGGAIGDCELRRQSHVYCDQHSIPWNMLFMNQLMFEVYRKYAQPVLETPREVKYVWECNECGSQEYTMAVSEDDVHCLGCSKCGGDEWHKEVAR